MFENRDTVFTKGRILTKEMLDLLYAWPRQTLQLYCRSLSEGVICGLEYEATDDDILIQPGMLWKQGSLWFLQQKLSLKSLCKGTYQEGKRYSLQLLPETTAVQGGVTTRLLDVTLKPLGDGMVDLGSFYYHQGQLPHIPATWEEVIESLNHTFYFNLSHLSWAAPEEATFHPLIFSCLAQALEKKACRSALETVMLVQLYERGTLTMKTLRLYTGDTYDVSRDELLKHIDEALQKANFIPPSPKATPQEVKKVKPISGQRGMI
ncbi:hypothetical protein [uncultured Megasphaera sp.]|uniref:hypothetical protein n=1 Tax=uncultured Megasphaera sp. TaxID=165188 RepID=UPI002593CAB6|nr:hypothetical protein [uncultured Megasphaera sp.]